MRNDMAICTVLGLDDCDFRRRWSRQHGLVLILKIIDFVR